MTLWSLGAFKRAWDGRQWVKQWFVPSCYIPKGCLGQTHAFVCTACQMVGGLSLREPGPLLLQLSTSALHLGRTILMAGAFELWWGVWNTPSTQRIRYLLKWKSLRSVSTHCKCHMSSPSDWKSICSLPSICLKCSMGHGQKIWPVGIWAKARSF
jgi:hypothetical protein